MSAWVVSHDHIDYMTTAMKRLGGSMSQERAQELGEGLLRENERSVSYRYPNDTRDDLPGWGQLWDTYRFREWEGEIEEGVALAAFRSYFYQACEHPDHAEAESWKIAEAFAASLEQRGVKMDSDRGWSINRDRFPRPGSQLRLVTA